MKAFFSSLVKPKEKEQEKAQQTSATSSANKAATPTSKANESVVTNVVDAKSSKVAAPAAAAAPVANAAPTPAAPATNTQAEVTPAPQPSPLLPRPQKKHAKALVDDYVGLMSTLFDHSQPLKKETEYFLEQMEYWGGREPLVELPKVHVAARTVNVELPLVREKGTIALQEIQAQRQRNAQPSAYPWVQWRVIFVKESVALSHSFLTTSSSKDEARRTHAIPSLARLRALEGSLDRATADAKRAQHERFVAEYAAMHDKYGRNMDGTIKQVKVSDVNEGMSQIASADGETTPAAATVADASDAAAPTPESVSSAAEDADAP